MPVPADQDIVDSIRSSLQAWCASSGAFLTARNGGAEAVLRNIVLGGLEEGFRLPCATEADEVRCDAAIYDVSDAVPSAAIAFEFKHNMLHRSQMAHIRAGRVSAPIQLDAMPGSVGYYVHFVHALTKLKDSPIATQYERITRTGYKRFQTPDVVQNLLVHAHRTLGMRALRFTIASPFPGQLEAALFCWVARVDGPGGLIDLVGTDDPCAYIEPAG